MWKPELWLALIRVVTGAIVLRIAWGKFTLSSIGHAVPIPYPTVSPDFIAANSAQLTSLATATPVGWHRSVLETYFLPRSLLVGAVHAWADLAVGLCLLLGLLTGLAALVGLVVALHVSVTAFVVGAAEPLHWFLPAAMLAFAGSRAGRAWGLDAVLRRRASGALRYLLALLT